MPLWWAWEKNRLSIKGRWLKYFARSSTPSSLLLGVLQAYKTRKEKRLELKTVCKITRCTDETWGGTIQPPQLSLSVSLAQIGRAPNLSQVHQISDLILIAVAIFTVVFQNEVLATRKQSQRVCYVAEMFSEQPTHVTQRPRLRRGTVHNSDARESRVGRFGVIIMLSVPADQKSNNYNWGVTTVGEQSMGTFTMPSGQSEQEVAHCKCIIETFY